MNHYSREATWKWLKDNWKWLHTNLGSDLSFHRMPIYVAQVHGTDEFTTDYISFFSKHMSPGLERSYKQGLEMLEWHTNWRNRDEQAVTDYFTKLQ